MKIAVSLNQSRGVNFDLVSDLAKGRTMTVQPKCQKAEQLVNIGLRAAPNEDARLPIVGHGRTQKQKTKSVAIR